ncbi:exported hypothetical protein [Verrucomicrobia bacterium]|nr:exported hypothetical protein [Verrucomicrobiota bacterium]
MTRFILHAWVRFLAMAAVLSVLHAKAQPAPMSRGESRSVFGYDTTKDFLAFDPQYLEKRRQYTGELRELQLELARQTAAGRATPCSRQIFLEARWLSYSAQWQRIERRLHDLREMLARPADPADARDQVEVDGSYDHCSEAWFLKLDSTLEELEDRASRGEGPKYPLQLLDRINSPEKLRSYLDSILVSDIRHTGIDNRFELNIAITAIERLIQGELGDVYPFDPRLKQALLEYEDEYWQNPETGYWGTWYKQENGELRKTSDLSVTFHIISYRHNNLKRVPEMINTTLAFKDLEYPYGWLEEGKKSNHHNYAVVRLFRICWPSMSEDQRELARTEMRQMIKFCLTETLNADGSFKLMDEDTVGSSYMFPVELLDETGYFRKSRRFWTDESLPGSMEVAKRVAAKIQLAGLTDTESRKALRRLQDAQREARRRSVAGALEIVVLIGIGYLTIRFFRRRREPVLPN